jgi:AraC family transcriptional regulator, arabinose operon regulatory protein
VTHDGSVLALQKGMDTDPRIARATAEIESRLGEPLTVATLARAVELSPSRFAHLFRTQTGRSPMRYLHERRMVRARLMLERTTLSVKEVMAHVGCRDASHFTRDFRRFHGMSPTECRSRSKIGRALPAAGA